MDQVHATAPYWFPVLPTMLFVFGVLGLLAWNRWLSHKETMRLAELGGGSRETLGLRERWRARHGVLWAVRVLAIGVALAVALVIADNWDTYLGRRVIGGKEMLLLTGAAVFLLLVGAVTLIAYGIWSRRDVAVLALGLLGDENKVAPGAGEEAKEETEVGRDAGGERSE